MTPGSVQNTSEAFSVYFSYPSEQLLLDLIGSVQHSLTFVGPGMTTALAQAIAVALQTQSLLAPSITVDLNPEVCRLGFGELSAIEILVSLAAEHPGILQQRTGLRLCALTVDEKTVIFPPAPRLVESPDVTPALLYVTIPVSQLSGSHINEYLHTGVAPQSISAETVTALKQDLQENPPLPFDLTQKIRVFNAQFEFVDFELKGLALSRKRVPLPSFLLSVSKDPKVEKLLQSNFRLIGDDTDLSSDIVLKLKKRLMERYLIILPNYGNIILRAQKPRFQRSVRFFKRYVVRYQKKIEQRLEEEMMKNRAIVSSMLFPLVRQNVPSVWRKYFSGPPSDTDLRQLLNNELDRAFGAPADHFQKMSCSVLFKGITYELLNDKQFVEISRKHIKSAVRLHDEYDAAKARLA